MISATAASTSAAVSRLSASRSANCAAKSAARLESLRGIGRLSETIDPGADLLRPGLERRAVHDEPRGDLGDALDLDEPVRPQGGAGLHEIDDAPAKPQLRRQLHRAVELDALGLHAARREMPARDLRVLGRDPHAA